MRSLVPCFLAVFLTIATVSPAQEKVPALDKWAWWPAPTKNISFQRAGYFGFSQPQQVQMRANMARILEQVHQTPVLNPPKGFRAGVYASLCEYGCEGSKVITGESSIVFLEYYRRGTDPAVKTDEEGPSLNLYFNSIERIVRNNGLDKDAFFEEPPVTAHEQGFPVYGNLVVITNNKAPLFVPLSREQYQQWAIKTGRQLVADLKKTAAEGSPYQQWLKNKQENIKGALEGFEWAAKVDPVKAKADKEKFLRGMEKQDSLFKAEEAGYLREFQQRIAKAEQEVADKEKELAGWPAAARARPMVSPDGRTYMRCNPSFFRTDLPGTAIQLILIDLHKNRDGSHVLGNRYNQLMKTIRETIDLRKLQALLP